MRGAPGAVISTYYRHLRKFVKELTEHVFFFVDFLEHLGYISNMPLLQHVSPEENMNRWYFVGVQPTLFDTVT